MTDASERPDRFADRQALIEYLQYAVDEVAEYDVQSAALLRMAIAALRQESQERPNSKMFKYS